MVQQTKKEKILAEVGGNIAESTGGMPAPLASRVAPASPAPRPARMQGVERARNVAEIAVERIMPDPDQPRKDFPEKELDRLAESMKAKGQLQPIRVMWNPEASMYRIIMGERRYRAAMKAGLPTLSCVIHDGPLGPAELLTIQMIENVHREGLSAIEQAHAMERLKVENNWNQTTLAHELCMSQGAVAKTLALLKLPEEIQSKVESGKISKHAARQIARVDSPEAQARVASAVEKGSLTVEETAEVVKASPRRAPKSKPRAAKRPAPKKATTWAHNFDGIKILATRGRGLTPADLRPALASALERIDSEIGAVA
jgi:ParB family transcriptional regulator, chromosome partitioning protein